MQHSFLCQPCNKIISSDDVRLNKIIFCGRDGVGLTEIVHEHVTGYNKKAQNMFIGILGS